MRAQHRAIVILGSILAAGLLTPSCSQDTTPPSVRPPRLQSTIYHADPNHLWNRLHTALFVRADPFGGVHGAEALDPLTWPNSRYLVASPAKERAQAALVEFLTTHGENLIQDPVKRAILQHDLWAIFDWASDRQTAPEDRETVADLQDKLAQAISRVALSPEQIAALPDTYSLAVASQAAGKAPANAGLPPDLFLSTGPWVCLNSSDGTPVAPSHIVIFSGHSTTFTFVALPGGRIETEKYVSSLRTLRTRNDLPTATTNPQSTFTTYPRLEIDVPPFPAGTRFAQVRRINLIDSAGRLASTRITEIVHLRTYHEPKPDSANTVMAQALAASCISRSGLFADPTSALASVHANDKAPIQFLSRLSDPFEATSPGSGSFAAIAAAPAVSCIECHHGSGGESFVTASTTQYRPGAPMQLSLVAGSVLREQEANERWKMQQDSWKVLQSRFHASAADQPARADRPLKNP